MKQNNNSDILPGFTSSPPMGFLDTSSDNVTEDEILDYLARIIADIYLSGVYDDADSSESTEVQILN